MNMLRDPGLAPNHAGSGWKELTLDEYDPPQSPLLKGGSARAPLLAKEGLGEVETILTNSYVEARNG